MTVQHHKFFRNLAQIDKDKQIIVFDNEIPPTDLTGITYQHFTGNVEIDFLIVGKSIA